MNKIIMMATIITVLCSCGSVPQEQKALTTVKWEDSIKNPENADFIDEVAFNEGLTSSAVTQQMFDARYSY